MARVTKNSFNSGINVDVDTQVLPPTYYTDSQNLSLVEDGKFLSLKNISGTTLVSSITGTITTIVDGNVRSITGKYTIGTSTNVNVITNFITGVDGAGFGVFYITAYDLDNHVLYYLFQQSLPTDYFTSDRIVDIRSFAENGIDIYYFTDSYNEIRQLRGVIPTGYTPYFLSDYDLSLQRRGANGTVSFFDVGGLTGTLLSGTYQYAYRMVDPTTKKFTKWSSLCNPIHCYQTANTAGPVYSAIGVSTPFAIRVLVIPSAVELAEFSYYQLAVIENIYPLVSPVQPAALLPITPISGSSDTFIHSVNQKTGLVPIEDLVVDLAAIKAVKTLAIKQDRLHAANIKYWNLEMDKGTPTITGGSITTKTGTYYDPYSDHNFSSADRGYFRDETYRFGIVYRDIYGNKAPVQVLDLHTVTGNQITGSVNMDVHFPGRDVSASYTLFNSSGKMQTLGLDLTGIHNHPTWAVGFEIVRVKRIKRILFQTPIIPMVGVQGVGAIDDYPSLAVTIAATAPVISSLSAQPQTNSVTYVPKNLFWPEKRDIRLRQTTAGAGINLAEIGEAELTPLDMVGTNPLPASTYALIFPPSSMYGDTPYSFGGFEKIKVVDYALAKLNFADFNVNIAGFTGDSMKTQVSGTFYSLLDGDYYYDSGGLGGKPAISSTLTQIKDYNFSPNLGESFVLGGNKIYGYSDLDGTGVNWGYKPNVQKGAVVQLGTALTEINSSATTFANGVYNAYNITTAPFIVGAAGPKYQNSALLTNFYINVYANFTADTSYVQAFKIVNVLNDFGDDRYGPITTNHDYISTGASYTFSAVELAQVQAGTLLNINMNTASGRSIFGGDCFVAAHTFKISDSAYSVVNQAKNTIGGDASATLLTKWDGKYYLNGGGAAGVSLPVALQGSSQFVEVVLESEYNGGVMAQDIINSPVNVNGIPVMNLTTASNTLGAIRSPLLYAYNTNLSKQNDQKVYVIKQPFSFIQYGFKSRDLYSDIKVYGTDVQGFDVFRVGNIFDLEESRGAITKLAVAGDFLYAVQESGVVFLPTSQNQIQETDGGSLAVGADLVIGRPIIIDQNNGGQHLNAIVETGSAIYIADVANKAIYKLTGTNPLESLNNRNFYTSIRTAFSAKIPENKLVGFWNTVNKEFWLANNQNNTCTIFNENIGQGGAFVGNYEFFSGSDALSSKCIGGTYGDQNLYLISDITTGGVKNFSVHTMYTGSNDSMFGRIKTPRVSFVVNPDASISKTFDVVELVSDQRLASMDLTVQREAALSDQVVNNISLNNLGIEGSFRVKTLRDAGSARLRGTRMLATIKWLAGNVNKATLTEIITKYRYSARTPF